MSPKALNDQFTGKLTLQERWRARQRVRNKCQGCKADSPGRLLCAICGAKANERAKLKRKLEREFKDLTDNPKP